MKILFIETFYSGSHRYFADRWISGSKHSMTLVTMPGRYWKWRQAGASMYLAEILPDNLRSEFDAAVVSGMLDLSHLKTLRPDMPPVLLYMHENQFDYPLSPGEEPDYRYGIVDMMNGLVADSLVFNSRYNRDTLLDRCTELFGRLPDSIPRLAVQTVKEKSRIIYPGVDTTDPDSGETGQSPLIIWNHRHEHDKNPEEFFRVLERLKKRGIDFTLALLGERFTRNPPAFDRAREVLSDRIVVDEYPSREIYLSWLARGDVVVSTAFQENFGLAIIEAASAGCWPLLPGRLAYPEIMPRWVNSACFYDDESDLEARLASVLGLSDIRRKALTVPLSRWLSRYNWKSRIRELDEILETTALRAASWP